MSEANTQGASKDVGSSTTPGSSSSRQAADQAAIRDRPMRQPKRGSVMNKIIADFSKSLSSNSSTA
ncbi:hypothetical protein CRYUN_Cryun27aG0038300 [Craigia yunnanensis]